MTIKDETILIIINKSIRHYECKRFLLRKRKGKSFGKDIKVNMNSGRGIPCSWKEWLNNIKIRIFPTLPMYSIQFMSTTEQDFAFNCYLTEAASSMKRENTDSLVHR